MTSARVSRCHLVSLLNGLYLILDERWSSRCSLLEVLREAGQAGVKLAQYRNKTGSMRDAYEVARPLREIAKEWGMMFFVNDRCDLAMAVEADGVHLGQTDLPIALARNLVGEGMLIGSSRTTCNKCKRQRKRGQIIWGSDPFSLLIPSRTTILWWEFRV